MISERANVRMQAALHAIRPAEAELPPPLRAVVASGWVERSGMYLLRALADANPDGDEARVNGLDMPRSDSLTGLLGVSLAYARTCLRAAERPVTALFSISEPYDDVIPVTTHVTFWTGQRDVENFTDSEHQLMLLSTEPTTFLYACDDMQLAVMSDTADALVSLGLSYDEAVARVNAFWADSSRRYPLLYGGWIGQQDGAQWAEAIRG